MRWQVLLEWPVPSVVANEKSLNFALPSPLRFAKKPAVSYKRSYEKCKLLHFSPSVAQKHVQSS